MRKINHFIFKVECVIGTIMMVSIVVLVFAAAIARSLHHPITWSMDLSQLFFVWVCMFGADIALKKCAHIGVDILVNKFPPFLQKGLSIFSYALCTGFAVFSTYWGFYLTMQNYLRSYATLKISYSFANSAIPIISCLMVLTLLEQLVNVIRNRPVATEEEPEADLLEVG
jgi:TRAP-type C4-dicarboxylate transport system permease small subunit